MSSDPAGDLEASLLVDLLSQDLQSSYLVRVEGPDQLRLAGLVGASAPDDLAVLFGRFAGRPIST